MKQLILDFLELIKIRILISSLLFTILGYLMSLGSIYDGVFFDILMLSFGTGCVFSSAAINNHVLEKDADKLMERTKNRPIPSGRVASIHAIALSLILFCLGSYFLLSSFHYYVFITSFLTLVLYDFVYTPLKKISSINTFVGAFPGAMPLLCGWFVINQGLSLNIICLFTIFYLWQLPHFFAIAWMNKDSYKNAGFKMVSLNDNTGNKTTLYLCVSTWLFLVSTIIPFFINLFGYIYVIISVLLAFILLKTVSLFAKDRSFINARYVLFASILYPPLLFFSIWIDLML